LALKNNRQAKANEALKLALGFLKRGWNPVPVSRKSKNAMGLGWQKVRITRENAEEYFNGTINVGVQLGPKSGGLTDVDLDSLEALIVGAMLLPKTDAIFGRRSKPKSHYLYYTELADTVEKACLQFKDPDGGAMMIELRIGGGGKGSQSVFPGSVHSSGEVTEWDDDGDPAEIDGDELRRAVQRVAVATLLARHWPDEGGRHDAALTTGGFLTRAGLDEDEVALMLEAIAKAAGDEEWQDRVQAGRDAVTENGNGGKTRGLPMMAETFDDKVARKAAQWLDYNATLSKRGQSARARPIIRVVDGELPHVVDEAERALLASGLEIYQRGVIVRPAVVPLKAADNRETEGWQLIPVTPPYLIDIMTRTATFLSYDKRSREWEAVDAPDKIAKTYLARAGEWKLPVLSGVVCTPFIRDDGSLCQEPGYDPASGLLFKPDGVAFPPIPERPSKKDALAALEKLKYPIRKFPYVTEADRSVALSGMLTPLHRRSLPTAPLHAFDAPVPGSGKSMQVDIASVIATGHLAPVIAQGKDEEELGKRLDSELLAGNAIISIDNCTHALESSALNMMLTQQRVKIRILGKSKTPEVPTNATMYATGNGLTVADDLTRRVLRGTIDAGVERPELREFDFDPVELAKERRPELVAAGLTVMLGYLHSGERVEAEPMGSFEQWSRWVREPLIWLGCDDPCATVVQLRDDDPKRGELEAVMLGWEEQLGFEKAYTVRDVIEVVGNGRPEGFGGGNGRPLRFNFTGADKKLEFKAALFSVAGDGNKIDHKRLGYWLQQNKNRPVGGARLEPKGLRGGSRTWQLVVK
jgi:hypothetical protein